MEDYGTLLKREKEKKRAARKRALRGKVEDTLAEIESTKKENSRLAAQASSLRQRMEQLRAVSRELEDQRRSYETHCRTRAERTAARSKPIEGHGLLEFVHGCGDEQMRHTQKGRHLRRTGYCVTYDNTRVLGPSEFVARCEREERARSVLDVRAAAAAAAAASTASASMPAKGTTPSAEARLASHNRTFAPSPLQDMGYHGCSSLPDLEGFKGKSLRRTRHYYDYEGKMIPMDPCDWPTHDGFVFIGM